jgi:hypothetical protein
MGKYLGMPLIHSKISKHTYAAVLDKVQSRLAGWKSKTLNLAGRLTLIQSISCSIPTYTMQTAKLPASTCNMLDKLNREFLWGDTENKKKIHLVKWDNVCRPKIEGGLGIKKTELMNQAMLAKTSWRIIQNDTGLWCKVLKDKYLKQRSLLDNNYKCPARTSSTWRSFVHGAKLIRKGILWRIGNGNNINFWNDRWVGDSALINQIDNTARLDLQLKVCDAWTFNGWNLAFLSRHFSSETLHQITKIPVNFGQRGNDKIIWGETSNGHFSVKSAYLLLMQEDIPPRYDWKIIWKLPVPAKLKTFCWLVSHHKLLTNMERVKRRLTSDPLCSICLSVLFIFFEIALVLILSGEESLVLIR